MDDGVLRIEPTRRAALAWTIEHGGGKVLKRHTYGPGFYDYIVGVPGEDWGASVAIVREDCLDWYWGPNGPKPEEIRPRYPYADRPHDEDESAC